MSVTIVWTATFEASPNGGESFGNGDNRIVALKTALRERLEKEHKFDPTGTQADHGQHLAGSAISYYKSTAPTTRPDGATALSAEDNGRIWVDSDDLITYIYVHPTWTRVSPDSLTSVVADEITDQEGGNNIKCKVIEIGDWNMDDLSGVFLSHDVTDFKTILAYKAIIRNDVDNQYFPLGFVFSGTIAGFFSGISGSTIQLNRTTGGAFDNVSFDSTSYNRGWVTIWYTD